MEIEIRDIDGIVQQLGGKRHDVIPVLQAIQEKYNYLPEEALRRVCEISEITPAQIVGVASFYSQFRFTPAGQHMIKVCAGTACHVKGAGLVYDAMKRELELGKDEDTTTSGTYTIEKVNCLGCGTLAPVVQIDEVTYGHVSTSQVGTILSDFESQKGASGKKKFKLADGSEVKGEIRIGLGSCCVAS
ncbi:MAG: NAD(P)H-dependent oxidoreductase subunit E, partial [Bacteroidales bacterium]|nr:NAD(P)H-dependent oxidoreductase subunit E [Bacteroidales bacterium]